MPRREPVVDDALDAIYEKACEDFPTLVAIELHIVTQEGRYTIVRTTDQPAGSSSG